ncbi:MAG TPA: response regulator [Chromatiales bacterium]|nr:response regulator [Chromatiales bacterium]
MPHDIDNVGLSQFLSEELKYLLLRFDEHNKLVSFEGNAAFYHFDMVASSEKNAEEILPFLTGIDTTATQYLPYVEFIHNIITDIYLYPSSSGFEVVLLETSKQHDMQQSVQQQSNENAILHYRLQQLDEKLKQNNALLEKANKAQSEFIATASHELKTPLSSILGYAELLNQYTGGSSEQDKAVTAIFTNGSYLLSLIDNLLEQGRVEGDHVAIQRRACSLSTLLTDIENIVRPLARKKRLDFRTESSNGNIALNIDEQHVRQVLINLLTNAIKYTENGHVTLKANYSDGVLQFKVTDTGIGILESELEEIMLPFRRAEHHNNVEGVGLGLSVSKKLAALMDGDLMLESTYGHGTIATFSIPADVASHGETASPANNKEIHVLLVEDDMDLSLLFENILTTHGFRVETVSDQKDLDRAMTAQKPELILMDHNVNGHDGLDLIQHVNKNGYRGKIIMMTASSEQSLVDLALGAGCCDFLQKPISRNRLIETIETHLK